MNWIPWQNLWLRKIANLKICSSRWGSRCTKRLLKWTYSTKRYKNPSQGEILKVISLSKESKKIYKILRKKRNLSKLDLKIWAKPWLEKILTLNNIKAPLKLSNSSKKKQKLKTIKPKENVMSLKSKEIQSTLKSSHSLKSNN